MDRRSYLRAAGAAGVVGAGGLLATRAVSRSDGDDASGETEGIEPVPIEALLVPGCDCSSVSVPERGAPTYLSFFSTDCADCERAMLPWGEAYDAVAWDVQFVSVTGEPFDDGERIREDALQWWERNDGRWAMGIDTDGDLAATLDVSDVPAGVVFDAENVETWRHSGPATADQILDAIEDARADEE